MLAYRLIRHDGTGSGKHGHYLPCRELRRVVDGKGVEIMCDRMEPEDAKFRRDMAPLVDELRLCADSLNEILRFATMGYFGVQDRQDALDTIAELARFIH